MQVLISEMLAPANPTGICELTPEIAAIVADDPTRFTFHRGMIRDHYLSNTRITQDAARRILTMPNLSPEAKFTRLTSAGFPALADQAQRDAEGNGRQGREP